MAAPHKKIEKYLTDHDSRYTAQKREIVEEIYRNKTHFEIEEFMSRCYAKHKQLSRATVYRTVKQLLEGGFLQKISTKDGKVFYEQTMGTKHHDHLICNICGKILEIKESVIDDYLNNYCKQIGFEHEYRSLHLYGTCSDCVVKG